MTLPLETERLLIRKYSPADLDDVARIFAAPALTLAGAAAAMGAALGALDLDTQDPAEFQALFQIICREIAAARPTAVNLLWA